MDTALVTLVLCATFALLVLLRREEPRWQRLGTGVRPYPLPVASGAAPRAAGARVAAMAVHEPSERGRATAPPQPPEPDPDAGVLESWRREQLLALGLDAEAVEGALRAGVDASAVRSLVERGCPPELALRILP